MKWAHKYRLIVDFINGHQWDLTIVAVDITWVTLWLRPELEVEKVAIILLEQNFRQVPEHFGSVDITNGIHEYQFK